jgi:hypothetical protein
VLALLLLTPAFASAQPTAPTPSLSFHFERPGLPVPEFTLTVLADGTGTYAATYAAAPATDSHYGAAYVSGKPVGDTKVSRPVALSAQTTARLFERVRSTDHFHAPCESKQKNVADTGAKTITYIDATGTSSCTYNYTENKAVAALTDTFLGIAETLDEGHTIDLKHRYDRLGLDRELTVLLEAIHDGRAIEVATIAPTLRSLADDTQVMERVRKRAAGLLESTAH